ncbi:hypothetical protein [Arthrobacter sp. zg-Y238]|uniref:hypothetical protein n=1 Tax=Arthrobacter sp. zg-Y238 TaxID=2964614 RepID=UPI002106D6C8|nr:hypothetical protein [Arthrobacter sp. zg-Y238]MCQ1952088.1 hypothetical protein [Arthrobacter sp. zg-Y238]
MPRRIRWLMLPVLAALLLGGCAGPSAGARPDPQPDAAAGFPFTVDNCGTPVTFEQPPEEVVAIKSTSIEMLLALGLEDRISGVAFPDGPYAAGWAPETEPPPHLDVRAQLETLELLRDLAGDGLTVITALHDVNLAARYADRIIALDDGRVVAAGETSSVLSAALVSGLYRVNATPLGEGRFFSFSLPGVS